MQSILPEHVDLMQKAKLGCEIAGEWPVSKLDRLADLLLDDTPVVTARLTLGREGRLHYLQGQVAVTVEVTCQRCMQPMQLSLNCDVSLGLISEEAQADRLPEGYEPLLVEDGKMSLPAILEDELLLAMPLVAMHDYDCSDYMQQQKQQQAVEEDQMNAEKEKNNPFSVLKDLL